MLKDGNIVIGRSDRDVVLLAKSLNRHGFIAGATGTGKTVTLKVFAESLSECGVPVFLADIKGDLSGLHNPGTMPKIQDRLDKMGIHDFEVKGFPVAFWDVYGEKGIPVRTTLLEMGPIMLSKLLALNDTQSAVLNVVFRVADTNGWLLIDIKDLRSLLMYVDENRGDISREHGAVSSQSIAAIQRAIMSLEDQGGNMFFGEPALNISDWIAVDGSGKGVINILNATKLFLNPQLYATFLLWMLSELYETLPEVGDAGLPKIVFFFDEAHTLFADTSKVLQTKIEQVVKLVRSKGVGVYFITQNPTDIPEAILAQCSNRIQHALRAYTPKEQKNLKSAAESFRENPDFKTLSVLETLATGEALVSFLDEQGRPEIVQHVMICPPQSSFDIMDEASLRQDISTHPKYQMYATPFDRESAYEILNSRIAQAPVDSPKAKPAGRQPKSFTQKTIDNTVNQLSRDIGRTVVRGLMGLIKGDKK